MSINHSSNYYDTSIKNIEASLMTNNPEILTEQNAELSQIKTDIDSDIISISKTLNRTIEQITKLESDNALLASNIQSLEDKREGSSGMYDDSRNLYNSKLIENSILFVAICAISYNVYKSATD